MFHYFATNEEYLNMFNRKISDWISFPLLGSF